jgi:hypothetical protein
VSDPRARILLVESSSEPQQDRLVLRLGDEPSALARGRILYELQAGAGNGPALVLPEPGAGSPPTATGSGPSRRSPTRGTPGTCPATSR